MISRVRYRTGVVPQKDVVGVAQLRRHARRTWGGRCECGDPYPCHFRVEFQLARGVTEPPPGLAVQTIVVSLVLALALLAIAFATAWWVVSL